VRVIVLDGNENQAVACVRSLGRAGFDVDVGADTGWSKAGWSRYCRRQLRYTPPQKDVTAFVTEVSRTAAESPGTLVLPMTERTTIALSEHRAALDAVQARYVLPAHERVMQAMDKSFTTELARSLRIATPLSVLVERDSDVDRLAASARYPLVLKPRTSEEVVEGRSTRSTGKPLYVRSAPELRDACRALMHRTSAVLAQEYIEGTGSGYFAIMNHGSLRAEFSHRRLRDVRPSGSGSALRESVPVDPRIRDAALPILEALRWHGPAMVEFRIRDDGSPVFLEVNGRFWNSLALAIHSGVDFPLLVARLAFDGDVAPVLAYRTGVRCRWWLGDVRHVAAVMRGRPASFEGRFPDRLETLAAFLTPVRGTRHDNFMWDDPLPELGDWIDFLGRRIPKALSSRTRAT
jgi:predicted ATP-grasp superfamily ATP-dependent carboligase